MKLWPVAVISEASILVLNDQYFPIVQLDKEGFDDFVRVIVKMIPMMQLKPYEDKLGNDFVRNGSNIYVIVI